MEKRILSFLLCLTLIAPMLLPGSIAYADDPAPNKGMEISKTATPNTDGTYTVKLEAYATGEKVTNVITEDVPTDIILVLDQSGSMSDPFSTWSFEAITGNNMSNGNLFIRRHNGGNNNLWHQLADGSYASVSVVRESPMVYTSLPANTTNSTYYSNYNPSNRYNLYQLYEGEYVKVTIDRSGIFTSSRSYTYTFADGRPNVTSTGDSTSPNLASMYRGVESTNTSAYIYTYSYTDANNVTHVIGTSTGQNTTFTNPVLYSREKGSITRLQALKNALTLFVDQVNEKVKGEDGVFGGGDDIDHRIAVVGFASGSIYNGINYNYGNTEILIGSTEYRYGTAAQGVYGTALQDMSQAAGRNNVDASIIALSADGGTLTDLGMEMANGILNANPVPSGEKRNRVVVVFTDGEPGWSGFNEGVANLAISQANTTKNTHSATVYTIGIFDGANAAFPLPANNYAGRVNRFMHLLSSNYLAATNMTNTGAVNPNLGGNSYYLSASDAGALSSIFKQIAENIETGGSETTLGEETVIKDIIAPSFTLPAGTTAADIVLESYKCTGVDTDGEYTWSKNPTALGATAAIGSTGSGSPTTTDNQLSITEFDFSGNWVGTETAADGTVSYRGNKLVITIIVEPREGFFGGNQVFTNTSAGIYENADETDPVFVFERPVVDVPLADIEIDVSDGIWGSYFRQPISQDAIKLNAKVTIAGSTLDFSKDNYGLEPWQNEYVDIETVATASAGNLDDTTTDISFTLTVTVKPKSEGDISEVGESGTGEGQILVFKPKVTFEDSYVWYGDTAVYGLENLVGGTWVHGTMDHQDGSVQMLNEEPDVYFTYTPESGKIVGGEVVTKQDIPVKVDVEIPVGTDRTLTDITSDTQFIHQACDPACGWGTPTGPGNPAFLLHVKTVKLNVVKENGDTDEAFLFKLLRNGHPYTEFSIPGGGTLTIEELPVGTYELVEDLDWSWRYTVTYLPVETDGKVTLSSENTEDTLTLKNNKETDKWLNDYSWETNIKGIPKTDD